MLLRIAGAQDPSAGHALQADVPPQPQVRQDGTPVPAEHAVGLPDMGIAGEGFCRTGQRALLLHFTGPPEGGEQLHPEPVFPGDQAVSDGILPGPVHIVCFTQQDVVQPDPAQGIDPPEDQQHPVSLQQPVFRRKGFFKGEIPLADGGGNPFVFPVIGIGNDALPKQYLHGRTGNGAGIAAVPVNHGP